MKPGDLFSVSDVAPVYGDLKEDEDAIHLGRPEKGSIGIFLDSMNIGKFTYYRIFTSPWGPVWICNKWVRKVG